MSLLLRSAILVVRTRGAPLQPMCSALIPAPSTQRKAAIVKAAAGLHTLKTPEPGVRPAELARADDEAFEGAVGDGGS